LAEQNARPKTNKTNPNSSTELNTQKNNLLFLPKNGGERIPKKAVITISLVRESEKVKNEQIEQDIFDELAWEPARIPWVKEVEKVTVKEE
jgi:hypothetical protein